jgi:hypothetical protein
MFIAKIPLQFQIKPEFHGDFVPLCSLAGLCPGRAGDLSGPQTPCLTRMETLVTALDIQEMFLCLRHLPIMIALLRFSK